ncbi:unnamed protein product [marine sediment metagenome]|uniref:Uncharacterized protein n=1 Tax=marine sediment metagenome TaxID=412755 RepID=X1C8X1_9ZZZZ
MRDKVLRRVLETVHVMTDQRIFRDGIDANGKLIGTYSTSYQKTRRRENYPMSRKVILQATSQMVNDYKFLVLPDGNYGSGFSNDANYDKSIWVEKTYKKPIFELTDSEDKKMEVLLEKELSKYLGKL